MYDFVLKRYSLKEYFCEEMLQKVKTICIAGAGTMGVGITQLTAQSGYKTMLFDIDKTMLEKSKSGIEKSLEALLLKQKISIEQKENVLANIFFTDNIQELKGDLIIEAIVEKLAVKQEFFQTVAANNSEQTIFASNTSSIPITQIASKIPHPQRVLGIHFFNPPTVMKLVEIISGVETDKTVADFCKSLIEGMGKTCVMVADSPGFIVNRVARHFYVEGLKIAEEKVAEIEKQFKLSFPDGLDLQSLVRERKKTINKIQKIDVRAITQDQVIDYADSMQLEIMTDDAGAIIILDGNDLDTFVNLINEDYITSEITGRRYEVKTKKLLGDPEGEPPRG